MSNHIKLDFDASAYEIAYYDRMYLYIWEDSDHPNECKFGERWVLAGQDPVEQCQRRAYESLGVRKDIARDGNITLKAIFDVSEMAKTEDRYYKQSRMDDLIRAQIGFRKGASGEVHKLSGQVMKGKVADKLSSYGQKLNMLELSTKQYEVAGEVLNYFDEGHRVILANLCARFGKTTWSGAVAMEADDNLIIVASYIKTVFASFSNDLKMFEQFTDCVHVDMSDPDHKVKITKALNSRKRVVAYLSLCNGSKRQSRINFLFKVKAKRFLIVDEADFGSHKDNQALPLVRKIEKDPKAKVILMTGTNPDRAVTHWPVDAMTSVTYPELLMRKRETIRDPNDWLGPRLLDKFRLNDDRDLLAPDFECYQMSMEKLVQDSIADGKCGEEFELLPSWSKFCAYPQKSKGFFGNMLEAVFLGKGGYDELNVDYQTENYSAEPRVAMMFTSANNKQMDMIDSIANGTLGAWSVVTLTGSRRYNGRKINQRNCQQIVSEIIETAKNEGKNVIIITNIMAQRSFSIPEITELYLAYDEGQVGSTIQKISRALTPAGVDKVAKIISLSFDPNRDDKFDSMIIETAVNHKKRNNIPSLSEAMSDVMATIDIFKCTAKGRMALDKDTYLEEMLTNNRVSRVLGKVVNLHECPMDIVEALASGNSEYITAARTKATQRGKTRAPKVRAKGKPITDSDAKMLAKAREVIVTILEHLGLLLDYSDTVNVADAFAAIEKDDLAKRGIEEDFGVSYDVIGYLIENDIIKQSYVELMYDA